MIKILSWSPQIIDCLFCMGNTSFLWREPQHSIAKRSPTEQWELWLKMLHPRFRPPFLFSCWGGWELLHTKMRRVISYEEEVCMAGRCTHQIKLAVVIKREEEGKERQDNSKDPVCVQLKSFEGINKTLISWQEGKLSSWATSRGHWCWRKSPIYFQIYIQRTVPNRIEQHHSSSSILHQANSTGSGSLELWNN